MLSALGRLPGALLANLVGANAAELTRTQVVLFTVGLVVIALAFWRYQETIETAMLKITAWLTDLLRSL